MKTRYQWLLSSIAACVLLPLSTASFALAFNIAPTPGTTLPTTITEGGSAAASYTVTNNTTRTLAGNSVRYLPLNVAVNDGATTCSPSGNFTLASGASCTLALNVSGAVDANDPDQHHHLFVCPSGSPACSGTLYPLNVTVSGGSQSSGTVACGLAGGVNNNNSAPLLVQNFNLGLPIANWSLVSVAGETTVGFYNGVSCSQSGASPVLAVAVGEDNNTSNAALAQSINGGASWGVVNIPGMPTNTDFNGVSCTGNGSTALCVAVGTNQSTSIPLLVQTTNNGTSWSLVSVPAIPANTSLGIASCSGSGASATCIAAGDDSSFTPVLIQTTNGGTNWSVVTVPALPTATMIYNGGSCIGSGLSTMCIATSQSTSTNTGYIVQTTNDGASWNIGTTVANTSVGPASCALNGSASLCVAVGHTTTKFPVLLQSTNAGASWTPVTVPGAPTNITSETVSCAASGSTFMCVAAYNPHSAEPTVVQTTNGGTSWSVVTISGTSGLYDNASCASNGSSAACTLNGEDDSGVPKLVQTTDGGTTWSLVTIAGTPSQGEYVSSNVK